MIVDAFMFYNELNILELRLELLDKYVDRFVLVESEVTHVGTPKELFFQNNKDRFAKWLQKITHIVMTAEEAPKDPSPWAREKYQRECIFRGLEDVPDSAIVMISDVDEIPDMTKVPFEKLPHVITSVHMWLFEYSLDFLFVNEPWFGTVITTLEIVKKFGPNGLRDGRFKFPCFPYSGWHLSSFGDPNMVCNKFETYAHARDGPPTQRTPEIWKGFIDKGIHTDGRTELTRRGPEVPLPAPVEVLHRLNLLKSP
jgi:beta-1,4-mannosyl-glycoprotein beta-1,4-N-acetylglucosaminyltransferase